MTREAFHTFPASEWAAAPPVPAMTVDGTWIGKVVRFSSPVLPGMTKVEITQFDIVITGRLTQVGHAAHTTTLALLVGPDNDDAVPFNLASTEPVTRLTEIGEVVDAEVAEDAGEVAAAQFIGDMSPNGEAFAAGVASSYSAE